MRFDGLQEPKRPSLAERQRQAELVPVRQTAGDITKNVARSWASRSAI
jgi:hypothetical protein